MPFSHRLVPRLYDTDRLGVVFFAAYYRFCQETLEELFTRIFTVPLEAAIEQGLWLCPVVHSAADYRHPLRLGQACDVGLQVRSLSEKSITYQYTICRMDGTLCASLQIAHVFCSPQTQRPQAIPPAVLAGLRRFGLLA
jgi:YbgC/YbaW family acyl-CoA thioester hydrolase